MARHKRPGRLRTSAAAATLPQRKRCRGRCQAGAALLALSTPAKPRPLQDDEGCESGHRVADEAASLQREVVVDLSSVRQTDGRAGRVGGAVAVNAGTGCAKGPLSHRCTQPRSLAAPQPSSPCPARPRPPPAYQRAFLPGQPRPRRQLAAQHRAVPAAADAGQHLLQQVWYGVREGGGDHQRDLRMRGVGVGWGRWKVGGMVVLQASGRVHGRCSRESRGGAGNQGGRPPRPAPPRPAPPTSVSNPCRSSCCPTVSVLFMQLSRPSAGFWYLAGARGEPCRVMLMTKQEGQRGRRSAAGAQQERSSSAAGAQQERQSTPRAAAPLCCSDSRRVDARRRERSPLAQLQPVFLHPDVQQVEALGACLGGGGREKGRHATMSTPERPARHELRLPCLVAFTCPLAGRKHALLPRGPRACFGRNLRPARLDQPGKSLRWLQRRRRRLQQVLVPRHQRAWHAEGRAGVDAAGGGGSGGRGRERRVGEVGRQVMAGCSQKEGGAPHTLRHPSQRT